jgi:hypothetical protein
LPAHTLSTEQIDKGNRSETEWPAVYAERRLAAQARTGLKPEALKLLLKVEARTASGIARDSRDFS